MQANEFSTLELKLGVNLTCDTIIIIIAIKMKIASLISKLGLK